MTNFENLLVFGGFHLMFSESDDDCPDGSIAAAHAPAGRLLQLLGAGIQLVQKNVVYSTTHSERRQCPCVLIKFRRHLFPTYNSVIFI